MQNTHQHSSGRRGHRPDGRSGGAWSSPRLVIPHPLFRTRTFVLDPLARIAPDWRDPLTGRSMRQLRALLDRLQRTPRR